MTYWRLVGYLMVSVDMANCLACASILHTRTNQNFTVYNIFPITWRKKNITLQKDGRKFLHPHSGMVADWVCMSHPVSHITHVYRFKALHFSSQVTFWWWIVNIVQHGNVSFILPHHCCHVIHGFHFTAPFIFSCGLDPMAFLRICQIINYGRREDTV
jgi:hypothetical protein